jgi:hypothetical protein
MARLQAQQARPARAGGPSTRRVRASGLPARPAPACNGARGQGDAPECEAAQLARRRAVLAALATAPAAAAWRAPPARGAAAPAAPVEEEAAGDFYVRWPYAQPSDILPFIRQHATEGDADTVLAALEEWAT